MKEIVVWGACPVGIHIDMETKEVIRVVVIDEELRYPKDIDTPVMEGDLVVSDTSYEAVTERAQAQEALELASGDAGDPWPAWDFGY